MGKDKETKERRKREEAIGDERKSRNKINWYNINNQKYTLDPKIIEERRRKAVEEKLHFKELVEKGQRVIIDFGFENLMSEAERKSLACQILYLYGDIKKSEMPFKLYLSDFHDDIKMRLEKMSGFNDWVIYKDERPFHELFDKKDLIYLSADSPNTINSLDSSKVYIIGGIVDRNRYKCLTYDRANNLGIETGRLPIDEGIKLLSSKVLTVNHGINYNYNIFSYIMIVGNILLNYQKEKDWKEAVLKAIPNRKLNNEDHLSKKQRRKKNNKIEESTDKSKEES